MTSAKRSIMINEPAPAADSPRAHPSGTPGWCYHSDDPDMTTSHHPPTPQHLQSEIEAPSFYTTGAVSIQDGQVVEVQLVALRPGTAQSLSVPLHTQAEPCRQGWLMDVSDSGGSIERPQDVWAGGPPDSAKMEAKGKPLKLGPQGSTARRPNGLQLIGGNAPRPLPTPGTMRTPICFV